MDEYEADGRTIEGPGQLSVLIPYKPPRRPEDWKLDFPPNLPPMVVYRGVRAHYWSVLEDGSMPYETYTHRFKEDDMEWLRGVQPQVEEMLRKNPRQAADDEDG